MDYAEGTSPLSMRKMSFPGHQGLHCGIDSVNVKEFQISNILKGERERESYRVMFNGLAWSDKTHVQIPSWP